jgi:hypothetical protein
VPNTGFRHHGINEGSDLQHRAFEQRDLLAVVVVQVDVQGRDARIKIFS